jgi:hypothetical protein
MVIAIDPGFEYPYIPKCDKDLPEGEQTTFSLKVLDAKVYARITNSSTLNPNTREVRVRGGTVLLDTLREGLVGWNNFKDRDGNPIDFKFNKVGKGQRASDESISRIPPKIRSELSDQITEMSDLNKEEAKNLESEQDGQQDT